MSSTKSQLSEAKKVESMQQDPSALAVFNLVSNSSYNKVNSVPDSAKDNPVPADHAPLVPSAYNQSVDFPIMSSPSQNKEHQPIVRQPEMNSEKCVQLQTCENERDRKRDDDGNCCSSFCHLCCMETCSCMVMCLEAAANSLQCIIACFICSELCQ